MRPAAIVLLLAFPVAAPECELSTAEALFESGDYRGAAAVYDSLEAAGVANGYFYLNQGNAHYLARQLPEAIRAYRRAERFIPNDRRLRANLSAARAEVLESPGHFASGAPAWLPRLSRPVQAHAALVSYVLAFALMSWWVWRGGRALPIAAAALLVLALAWAAALYLQQVEEAQRPFAVVRQHGVYLRTGNGDSYAAVLINNVPYQLYRGAEVRVLFSRPNGWHRVELANGVVGWLPGNVLLFDREPAS